MVTRLDLTKYTKIPVVIDDDKLVQDLGTTFEKSLVFSLNNMTSELLNDEITSPEVFFKKYINIDQEGIFSNKNLSVNLLIIPPNQAGIEYTKTKASDCEGNRIYQVLNGSGTVIIQNFTNSEGDVIIASIKKEQIIVVPKNYAISISNTKQTKLILAELRLKDCDDKYNLAELRGMSYYVIRKNAKQEIVQNPVYKNIKKYRKISWDKLALSLGITLKTPIIKQLLKKDEKITALINSDITI